VASLVARGNALLNTFRLNQRRLGEMKPEVLVILGGGWRHQDIRLDSMQMTDAINDEPNTLSFRMEGAAPVIGEPIDMVVGTWGNENKVFSGQILSAQAVYEGRPENVAYDVQAIDHTWLLKRRLVMARYTGASATTIVQDIVANFAAGYVANTAEGVQPGLPAIDEISFENEDVPNALSRVMEAVGGYWYVDHWRRVHAFLYEAEQASAITDSNPNSMSSIAQTVDLSQVSNRILARGGGSQATVDRPSSTVYDTIPVEDLGWYPPGGGWLEIGTQRLYYSGVEGGAGTGALIIGDMTAPAGGPAAAPVPNESGNLAGKYQYKVSFVMKEGESLASPPSAVVLAGTQPPDVSGVTVNWAMTTPVPNPAQPPYPGMPQGTVGRYMFTFVTKQGETFPSEPTAPSAPAPPPLVQSSPAYTYFPSYDPRPFPIGPAGTIGRNLYRSDNGGPFGLTYKIADNTTIQFGGPTYPAWDSNTPGVAPPLMPTTSGGKVNVTGIYSGPPGTTARNIYRTRGSGVGPFMKAGSLRDNTTPSWIDNVRDDSLGDEEPSGSGTLPTLPGSTALRVSAVEAFPATGWALTGGQVLSYTHREAGPGPGALLGIPASGIGAITAPLSVDTEVITAPHLTGIQGSGRAGILYPILTGDTVAILAIVDDAASQAAMAQAVGFGDGVHELPVSDSKWNYTEATARARAELKRRKDGLVTITFDTRDDSVWSGRDIYINVWQVGIAGWFKIRRLTFSQFGYDVWPLRRVEVSSQRFSFEDLLRQTRGEK
jgi:hypothetical protein